MTRGVVRFGIVFSILSAILEGSTSPKIAAGYFHELTLDSPASGPAIVAVDDEDVFVALAKAGKLAWLRNGKLRLFDMGQENRPVGLAVHRSDDGLTKSVWIGASYDNKLIRFDLDTKRKQEFVIEGDDAWPFNIAVAPDESVWFTERAAGRIGRLDPVSSKLTHFDVPTPNSGPAGLGVDARTGVVWFTESYRDCVASYDPRSDRFTEFHMGPASTGLVSGPAGLALDREGGVWFAKLEGKLGHIAPGSEQIELIDVPDAARRPAGVTVAPNNDVWMVALDGNLLLRYTPSVRAFTLYPLPTGQPDKDPSTPPLARTARPFGIAVDQQGNVWFSEQYTGKLGVLDIAAPEVEVLSPAGTVRTAETLLSVNAIDRVSGIANVAVHIDDSAAVIRNGTLDLVGLDPGVHRLIITATDHAGNQTVRRSEFTYAPGPIGVVQLVRQLTVTNTAAESEKNRLMAAALASLKGDVRANLIGLAERVRAAGVHFVRSEIADLERHLRFAISVAGRAIQVRLIDQAPGFSPSTLTVRVGDIVTFSYDPPSDGHSISHMLHRVEIDGVGVRSPLLRAGDNFPYRFETGGRYTVKDTEHWGLTTIEVVEK